LCMFAGSSKYSGAARLSARAAFHARAGLVTLYCDESIATVAAMESPSVIIHSLAPTTTVSAGQLTDAYQAIAAGPGWGQGREELVSTLLRTGLPMVLDADGITCFASLVANNKLQVTDHGPLVLTPHPGELHRMLELLGMPLLAQETGNGSTSEAFTDSLRRVAIALGVVLVYKSHVVWIVDGRSFGNLPVVVDGMNSSLGVAGSGDVLTGIIGAFLAQGMDALDAAKAGVIVHQKAGRIAREAHSWFDSQELVDAVGNACHSFERGPV
jgi:ADP-dependent NAD(P)H-hydrate dehydratase / NAD(P)H-hydrate epimerase